MRYRRSLLLVVVVAALGALSTAAMSETKAAPPWRVVLRPNVTMPSVAADNRGVWVAGWSDRGRVFRFDGRRWSALRVPGVTDIQDLAVDRGVVWVLASPNVFRSRGGRWERLKVTGLPRARQGLAFSAIDVVDGDVWLAGSYDDSDDQKVFGSGWLIARLHAGRWRTWAGPDEYARLGGIAGAAAAVGSSGPQICMGPAVMLHWDGSRWRDDVRRGTDPSWLADVVTLGPANAWAVGLHPQDCSTALARKPTIMHWDGRSWQRWTVPGWRGQDFVQLNAVAVGVAARRDVWAGGNRYHDEPGASKRIYTPVLLHWNGTRWRAAPAPPVAAAISDLATAPDGTLWAVGDNFVARAAETHLRAR